jgi:tetratricopeptide (TPR) repeat protein
MRSGNCVNRRAFLKTACIAPALSSLVLQPAAYAEPVPQHAPYLKLTRFIEPGFDEFPEEAQAMEAEAALRQAIVSGKLPADSALRCYSLLAHDWNQVSPDTSIAVFSQEETSLETSFKQWRESLGAIRRAQFFVLPGEHVRFEVASSKDGRLLYTTGHWQARWQSNKLVSLQPIDETRAKAAEPLFRDVTGTVFSNCGSFHQQLCFGVPYWRARLDPASGIDIYGSNGIAVGDIDNDGVDEVYVSQPGGLPNRLFRFRDDRFQDITDAWNVALLDDTSAALFLDLRNIGRQDLVVLRDSGPLLYLNEGNHFRLRNDAFRFATLPQGGFTGMASADYDRDGRLDLYLCTYIYFQSEAQYTYAVPYHDARNGPPNFLFKNRLAEDGSGSFEDVTAGSGVNENNNRFSFAPTWCDTDGSGWPDLYVANDFGRNNFYRNDKGRFRDLAAQAGIEDLGPGMSSSWFDYDHDGRPDLYVGNMWTASGQRIVHSTKFAPAQGAPEFAEAYRRHTKGNSLYRNKGDGTFEEATAGQGVAMGRWAWSSVGHDFDNDGVPELAVGCGMLSNTSPPDKFGADAMSFFWRQVVSQSPQTAQRAPAYENGWNAINQFIREDYSWNGHEPNVFYAKRGGRYFDVSGISGFDFADDTRAFAITDFDGDGKPDLILKNRLGPQIRVLQNNCARGNRSIAFDLRGTQSNRDAIGARIEVLGDGPTAWLSAESGYLSQHSKRIVIGLGTRDGPVRIRILWPSGASEEFGPLDPGHTYRVTEGSNQWTSKPFSTSKRIEEKAFNTDNASHLHNTWFMEPLPLPQSIAGPALLILKRSEPAALPAGVPEKVIDISNAAAGQRETWGLFRRYLFDYRQDLETPLCLLIDAEGRAAKVYADVPRAEAVKLDMNALLASARPNSLPFGGVYQNEPHRDYFKFAAALLWEGRNEAALPYLHEALRRGSGNARIPMLIGQIYLQAGKVEEADQYIRKALEWNPSYADAWSELGGVYEARNNTPQALVCFEKALAFEPDLTYVQLNAAHAAEQAGDSVKAEKYYRQVLTAEPRNPDAANGLGLVLAKQGQNDEARKLFEQAIQARQDFGSAINNLAVLYLNTGQVNDAVAALEYGLKVAPEEDILYLNLGRVYVRQGQIERARGVMQRLLARKPGNAVAERALRELDNR